MWLPCDLIINQITAVAHHVAIQPCGLFLFGENYHWMNVSIKLLLVSFTGATAMAGAAIDETKLET